MKEVPFDLKVAKWLLWIYCILIWLLMMGAFDSWLDPRTGQFIWR